MVKIFGKVTQACPTFKWPKCDHNRTTITTDKGEYQLQRGGGNPIYDPVLQKLVNSTIEATGDFLTENIFLMTSWK